MHKRIRSGRNLNFRARGLFWRGARSRSQLRVLLAICVPFVLLLVTEPFSIAKPPLPPSPSTTITTTTAATDAATRSTGDAVRLQLECARHRGIACDRSNLFVKARNGRYIVTSVSQKLSEAARALPLQMVDDSESNKISIPNGDREAIGAITVKGEAPSAGDVLLGANGLILPTSTLGGVLSSLVEGRRKGGKDGSTTVLLPVVDVESKVSDATGGQPLLGLLRVEFLSPDSLLFEASGEKREELQREISKLLVDKERRRLRDLKRKAEEEAVTKADARAKQKKQKENEVGEKERQGKLEKHQKGVAKTRAMAKAKEEEQERAAKLEAKQKKDAAVEKGQKAKLEAKEKLEALDDGFDYVDSVHIRKGPLGLWFDPDPTHIPTRITKDATVTRAGDELVMVNSVDVLKMNVVEVVAVIQESSWPRTLKFRRERARAKQSSTNVGAGKGSAGKISDGDSASKVTITIQTPLIATTSIAFIPADFGTAIRSTVEGVYQSSISTPRDACKGPDYSSDAAKLRTSGKVVFAWRGKCVFQDKAENLERAGAKLVAVVNHAKEAMVMPKNPGSRHELKIPAVMVGRAVGETILKVDDLLSPEDEQGIKIEVSLESLSAPDIFARLKAEPNVAVGSLSAQSNAALLLWDGKDHHVHSGLFADWLSDGSTLPKVPGGSALAELRAPTPSTGCGDEAKFAAGKIAIVIRGGCSFDEKCLNAQKGGAKACVVVNKDEAEIAMNGGGDSVKITIPSIMVRASALKAMKDLGFMQESLGSAVTGAGDGHGAATPKRRHLARIVYSR